MSFMLSDVIMITVYCRVYGERESLLCSKSGMNEPGEFRILTLNEWKKTADTQRHISYSDDAFILNNSKSQ